jgi:hypothetical protein
MFWAGYASSAVVEAISDFWQYFDPIRQSMPQNCSADVQAVIAHIDCVFAGSNATAISEVKQVFRMGGLGHLDDVAGARACARIRIYFPFLMDAYLEHGN